MEARLALEPVEARIVGVLIEKELTTPDQYPLTLNALTAGCNQRSNRDPVLELSEAEVRATTGKLIVKGWIGGAQLAGSRVERFRHNAAELLGLARPELAVVAELLLRGAQQPGELRARAERMAEIPTLDALRGVLEGLAAKSVARRQPPAPGARAESWMHTIGAAATPQALRGPPVPQAAAPVAGTVAPEPAHVAARADDPHAQRLTSLEHELQKLRRQLANLAWKLGEKLDPP
jgi:hypothetical protein